MTIPLAKLYHFLDDVVNDNLIIYRWSPNGSKLLKDLQPLKLYSVLQRCTCPIVICHDQEPLNFTGYTYEDIFNVPDDVSPGHWFVALTRLKRIVDKDYPWKNQFNHVTNMNLYSGYILLHSEKNSLDLEKYTNAGAVLAHYWSHAVIARDWFRYAKIDPKLTNFKDIKKDFLVYNRSWSGSREYRLKFSELVIHNNLDNSCHMNFSSTDSEQNYQNHVFVNSNFKISTNTLEDYFLSTVVDSNSSADYNSSDYNSCLVEVVLETVYDSQKIHLTEKSLRPIACKMPFIIAGGPHSLQYLRDYGFKTFDSCWDESYDKITDSSNRLKSIVQLMKKISLLSESKKRDLYYKSLEICEYNHQLFFSDSFFDQIVEELKYNITSALTKLPKSKEQLVQRIDWQISFVDSHGKLDLYHKEMMPTSVIETIRNLK